MNEGQTVAWGYTYKNYISYYRFHIINYISKLQDFEL